MPVTARHILKQLQKEFLEATVHQVDMDRVDVVPRGSGGSLHSLPIVGDREKIQPGDTVKVVTIAGERVVLAPDLAVGYEESSELGEMPDQWKLDLLDLVSNAGFSAEGSDVSASLDGWDGWTFLQAPLTSPAWTSAVISTASTTAINISSTFGVPAGAEAVIVRTEISESGAWGTAGQNWYFGMGPAAGFHYQTVNRTFGGGIRSSQTAVLNLDAYGSAVWRSNTSGTNTMTVTIDIWGYKMPSTGASSAGSSGWVYLNSPRTHPSWTASAYSNTPPTDINMVSTFGIPAGTKAVLARIIAHDPGSFSSPTMAFSLFPKGSSSPILVSRIGGKANSSWQDAVGIVPLDSDGICQYSIGNASGTNSMTCWLQVWGYLLGDDRLASGIVYNHPIVQGPNWNYRGISSSVGSSNSINVFSEFGVPQGAAAVRFRIHARDTGSAAHTDLYFALYRDFTVASMTPAAVRPCGITNNAWTDAFVTVPVNPDGMIYWRAQTSGTNSMTINLFCTGYDLPAAIEKSNAETINGYQARQIGTDSHVLLTGPDGSIQIDGMIQKSTPSGCRLIRTTGMPVNSGTLTPLAFDTRIQDTDFCWSIAEPTRLYARRPGFYMAGGSIEFSAAALNVACRLAMMVRLNGTTYVSVGENHVNANTAGTVGVTAGMFWMAAGDYVELTVFQNTGAAKTSNAATTTNQHLGNGWLARTA
jgi:hypothetical protein